MMKLIKVARDDRGAAIIEMALGLPVLLLFIFGIFQFGVILQANAGMQHALGEGARFATIYPSPEDGEIVERMSDKVFGMNVGHFNEPTVTTPPTTQCENCKDLEVSYTVTPDFILVEAPPITLTRTKRVYQAKPIEEDEEETA